jgi:hypothetical protein
VSRFLFRILRRQPHFFLPRVGSRCPTLQNLILAGAAPRETGVMYVISRYRSRDRHRGDRSYSLRKLTILGLSTDLGLCHSVPILRAGPITADFGSNRPRNDSGVKDRAKIERFLYRFRLAYLGSAASELCRCSTPRLNNK